MSPLHPASLVHPSQHSYQMFQLLELSVDRYLIEYIIQTTIEVVAHSQGGPSTSQSRGRSTSRSQKLASFAQFASNVVSRSEVPISVLLVTLVYIERSKPYLAIDGEDWACERVFLGALMLAAKFTNDSTLKNIHWALITGVFGKRDVGRIEREFLDVLAWELGVLESDILQFHDSLMSLHPRAHYRIPPSPVELSSAQSEESSYWSDSDSDESPSSSSSSPAPLTPPIPSEQVEFVKSPSSHKRQISYPFDISDFLWNTPALVPMVQIAT